jgi:BirA family biotin operon repressor/biotin-[acetyl-CoA-carboxylase] ligase
MGVAAFDIDRLKRLVARNPLAVEIRYFDTLPSTNSEASALAERGACHGTVVIAGRQTRGRGREGRHWLSGPEKGVTLSILLRPPVQVAQSPIITLAAAVAVARVVEKRIAAQPEIRWPNDVFVRGKKIAGILAEAKTGMMQVTSVVTGIGLNVNDTPPDIPADATSLCLETGREADRVDVIAELLDSFGLWYSSLCRGFPESVRSVLEAWKAFSRRHEGTKVTVTVSGEGRALRGVTCGVRDSGALCVRTGEGRIVEIFSGTVRYEL